MKKNTVDMGCYYTNANQKTLVKTVCRATSPNGKEPIIIFAFVGEGGIASSTVYMPESEFLATYIL